MKNTSEQTSSLLEMCRRWVHRYVVLTSDQGRVLAAWILHTWVIEAAECTPYLHITAPEKGCGKSTLLEILEPVVRKPCKTGGISAAALVRTVDKEKPTLLLDEMDAAFGGDKEFAEILRGILNEGFRRGGNIRKCDGKQHEVRSFQVFCPKALAGIGRIPDTVSSRSIVIELRRKTAEESVEPNRMRDVKNAAVPVWEALQSWSEPETVAILETSRPAAPKELSDRQADISDPLLAIADLAGGEWPQRLRSSLVALFRSVSAEDASYGALLLKDIQTIFRSLVIDSLYSVRLIEALKEIEESPWAEWDRGKGLTPSSLAKLLRRYNISPSTIRIGDGTGKGYKKDAFRDVWTRYLSRASEEDVTAVTIGENIDCRADSAAVTRSNTVDRLSKIGAHELSGVTTVTPVTAIQVKSSIEKVIEGVI